MKRMRKDCYQFQTWFRIIYLLRFWNRTRCINSSAKRRMLYGKKEGNVQMGWISQEIEGQYLSPQKTDQGYRIPSGIWQWQAGAFAALQCSAWDCVYRSAWVADCDTGQCNLYFKEKWSCIFACRIDQYVRASVNIEPKYAGEISNLSGTGIPVTCGKYW